MRDRTGPTGADARDRADVAPSSRDKILDTAEPLFARNGFAGLGMRELADRVGLSKSSLFHHFPSKVSLYVSVLERVLLTIETRLAAASPADSPLERLRRWVDRIVDTLAENPAHAPLLLRTLFEHDVAGPDEAPQVDAAFQRVIGRVASCLAEGIAQGQIRDVSIPHTIQTLIGMTVYHFASGDVGEDLLGHPIYSAEAVRARKRHIASYIDHGLALESD